MQSLPALAGQAARETLTGDQVYQEGVRQIQRMQWDQAIDSMLTAKKLGPAAGRRIPFYGDVFDDFLPDYYLAVAYTNRQRYKEAASVLESLQRAASCRRATRNSRNCRG